MSQLGCTIEQESKSKVRVNMMVIAPNTQCSGGGGGDDDDGHRTVECLRGRLLAERVASKAAKHEAQQMAKRLEEIEKRLDEEVKSRDRAERKLKRALKKLESLKILDSGSISDLSSSSSSSSSSSAPPPPPPPSSSSSSSPSQCLSGYRASSEEKKPNSPAAATDSDKCGSVERGKEEALGLMHSEEEIEGSLMCSSHYSAEPNKMKSEATRDCTSQHDCVDNNARQETMELQSEHAEDNNKMAIVPASVKLNTETYAPNTETYTSEKMNQNVQGVLLALRQVREQLQSCVARRSDFCSQNELCGRQGRFSSTVLRMP